MHLCNSCGAEISPGTAKCRYCGSAAPAPPTAPLPPPPAVHAPAAHPGYVDQKSKIAAGILGILLGAFGIHNFYLGYTVKGVAQLLLTLLTCGYLALVSAIWGMVEGILILTGSIRTDGRGVPLKD